MTCKTCAHWKLKDATLSKYGFGWCKLERPPFDRAREFSATAVCNKGQHTPATAQVIEARKRALKA